MNVEEFEKLIRRITAVTDLQSDEIAVDMGYNKGYISQIKSRNNIPDKFVNALKNKYLPDEENNQSKVEEMETPYGNVTNCIRIIEDQLKLLAEQHQTLHSQQQTIHFLVTGRNPEMNRKKAS